MILTCSRLQYWTWRLLTYFGFYLIVRIFFPSLFRFNCKGFFYTMLTCRPLRPADPRANFHIRLQAMPKNPPNLTATKQRRRRAVFFSLLRTQPELILNRQMQKLKMFLDYISLFQCNNSHRNHCKSTLMISCYHSNGGLLFLLIPPPTNSKFHVITQTEDYYSCSFLQPPIPNTTPFREAISTLKFSCLCTTVECEFWRLIWNLTSSNWSCQRTIYKIVHVVFIPMTHVLELVFIRSLVFHRYMDSVYYN